ncbi:hypothetical protein K435DRAFT_447717 [Dendrothele bispora CBS 962.96]|uniref:Uncharacterized protein n=1 Tax=Dendrothele bispora (strain CBS 962.96) TaxID=1314807 RepID=A0A4S8L244_DENBC|nr:hypothetical protein K435DRAFT_447717 [Dendrothele bispora CBS 962.96]
MISLNLISTSVLRLLFVQAFLGLFASSFLILSVFFPPGYYVILVIPGHHRTRYLIPRTNRLELNLLVNSRYKVATRVWTIFPFNSILFKQSDSLSRPCLKFSWPVPIGILCHTLPSCVSFLPLPEIPRP